MTASEGFHPPEYGPAVTMSVVNPTGQHSWGTFAECSECGATLNWSAREKHTAFHKRLYHSACRG